MKKRLENRGAKRSKDTHVSRGEGQSCVCGQADASRQRATQAWESERRQRGLDWRSRLEERAD